ncbi:Splicing factor 3B subunit [Heracleum sosnowskyi]|uniref:Splicing factor 3B subunit n=1 Tax=Heracleum sosnowskyi TaxID=360622 RepID=A0AAD8MMD2_9APIA|nr:Splicing factor 3B subunit [Heracleum sosnowskyi]
MDLEVLHEIKKYASSEGADANYIRRNILPGLFHNFWIRSMALNPYSYKQLVETTFELAKMVGAGDIVGRIVDGLKDESEPYRKMVMETIGKVVADLGASDIDATLEQNLIDGVLYAFVEQTSNDDDDVMLNGFCAVVKSLGRRMKPYMRVICGIIKWRLNNRSAKARKQAVDVISRIAVVFKHCEEEQLMRHLAIVLYRCLREEKENSEVLASTLGALKAISNVTDMTTRVIRNLTSTI